MSDSTDFATLAADVLRERPEEARPREISRDVGIGVIAQAMAERRRRRAVRRVVAGMSVLSAAAAAAMFYLAPLGAPGRTACVGAACRAGHVRVEGVGGSVSERTLAHGQSVTAGQGHPTVVEFATGTRITLTEHGELVYREDTALQRFGLVHGTAHLTVAKLTAGQRFIVDTDDAEVEVRGTVFDVAVRPPTEGCLARTAVSVTEGAVEVRSHGGRLVLHPGETWESACTAPPTLPDAPPAHVGPRAHKAAHPAGPEAPAAALLPEPVPVAAAPAAETAPASASDARKSELLAQNDLYQEATSARQAGESSRALELYEKLLERYPGGPLSESAGVERIRLLERVNPARARTLARGYLGRYRNGFARAELEALLAEP